MEYVEKSYGKLPTQQIADFLGRGIPAVRAMALKLGVGRTGAKPWSPAEIAIVKKYYSHGAGIVMVQTLLPHRDKESTRKQAAKAGVTDARDWHPDAIKFLKEHYGHMNVEDIATILNKTVSAVRNRATVLKLGKVRLRKWTPEENAILTSQYANSDNLNEIHALLPHRSRRAIATQATKLGLKRARAWTSEELCILRQFYPVQGRKIVAMLLGRTVNSVHRQAEKQGLRRYAKKV
ncbi:hypothetical protein ABS953_003141 [Salmonella enterica]|nr:hypothetical protein [Salmonella enterica]EDU7665816.1 hypothetical protein [Salmonella enterica subsp. enterica serovar Glostrup]EAO9929470.1 hypothetical protein [Salmonella enterica]EAR4310901.1 hypothetical protein [Salmonella enterica]EAV5115138.1 hypothetical protein [Salmonella enterica]